MMPFFEFSFLMISTSWGIRETFFDWMGPEARIWAQIPCFRASGRGLVTSALGWLS